MINFFLDTCIILDILSQRAEGYRDGVVLLEQSVSGNIRLSSTIQTFSNISYILKKQIPAKELIEQFSDLLEIIEIVPEDEKILLDAIAYFQEGKISDFEDAIQYAAATSYGCKYIISRDKQFLKADQRIITATQALKIISDK